MWYLKGRLKSFALVRQVTTEPVYFGLMGNEKLIDIFPGDPVESIVILGSHHGQHGFA